MKTHVPPFLGHACGPLSRRHRTAAPASPHRRSGGGAARRNFQVLERIFPSTWTFLSKYLEIFFLRTAPHAPAHHGGSRSAEAARKPRAGAGGRAGDGAAPATRGIPAVWGALADWDILAQRLAAMAVAAAMAMAAWGYDLIRLPTQSQLPVANIHCIFQDSEDYCWYGTTGGGLCRDDGYQVVKFGGGSVTCIAEDRGGDIWFGSNDGLYVIDKRTYRATPVEERGRVSALMCDRAGRVWVGAEGGVLCLDAATRRTLLRDTRPGEPAAYFYEDSRGSVWILYWQSEIWRCAAGAQRPAPYLTGTGLQPTRIHEDRRRGGYWVATHNHGIVFYDDARRAFTPQPATERTEAQRQVLDMAVDEERGRVYVTSTDDLYLYRIAGRTLIPDTTSLPTDRGKKVLDGLCIDRQGNTWVGGFIPTTFILSPSDRRFTRRAIDEMRRMTGYPLIADRVVADDGRLWISQGRVGLMRYDLQARRLSRVDCGRANSRTIERNRAEGGVWIGDGATLASLAPGGGTEVARRDRFTLDTDIRFINDLGDGTLLVGTQRSLHLLAPGGGGAPRDLRLYRGDAPVTHAVRDVDGRVFFLVEGKGLYERDARGRAAAVGGSHYKFTAIAMGGDGTLWAATKRGRVYALHPGARELSLVPALCDDNGDCIIDIRVDHLRHVWTLTDQYVKETNPVNRAQHVLRSTDPRADVCNFYKLEAAPGNRVGVGAAGAYFEMQPSLLLNSVAGDGRAPVVTAYRTDDSLRLQPAGLRTIAVPADRSSVTVYCSTNRPPVAAKISFAYHVEGDGDEWQYLPAGYNAIHLSNLPTGRQVLAVRATDEYGRWTGRQLRVTIVHAPRWWQTWWAQGLLLALVAALLYALWLLNRRIHLLQSLQSVRKRLSLKEIEIAPADTAIPGRGEALLAEAIRHVEEHLAHADYNVRRLSEDMCMSRANLYRRISELTGLSVIEFIRDIRLKQAAALLKKHPGIAIATVHTAVGFSSNSYFTKCFKEKFGTTPSEYQKAT